MKLNVGCGPFSVKGFINIDTYEGGRVKPDIVMSATDLQFPDRQFDLIYMGHVLEHLSEEDVPKALTEAHRVLKDTGTLLIVGPDYGLALNTGNQAIIDGVVQGGCEWPGDEHHWVCGPDRIAQFLFDSPFGFSRISTIEAANLGAPVVSHVNLQCAFRAVK